MTAQWAVRAVPRAARRRATPVTRTNPQRASKARPLGVLIIGKGSNGAGLYPREVSDSAGTPDVNDSPVGCQSRAARRPQAGDN